MRACAGASVDGGRPGTPSGCRGRAARAAVSSVCRKQSLRQRCKCGWAHLDVDLLVLFGMDNAVDMLVVCGMDNAVDMLVLCGIVNVRSCSAMDSGGTTKLGFLLFLSTVPEAVREEEDDWERELLAGMGNDSEEEAARMWEWKRARLAGSAALSARSKASKLQTCPFVVSHTMAARPGFPSQLATFNPRSLK
eukprot:scaffold77016_cov21-Tisochrysis_lutea.AAC.1